MHGILSQRVSNLATQIFTMNHAEDWRQLYFKSNTLMVTEHTQVISSVLVTLPSVKERLIRERFEPTLSCSDIASPFPAKQLLSNHLLPQFCNYIYIENILTIQDGG